MTAPKKAAGEGVPQAASKTFYERNSTKKPPYANRLNLEAGACLIVCSGSSAWDWAKSPSWFPGQKIALPFGDDPSIFAWSAAAGRDVMIAGFGELEPIGAIAKLGALLLAAGAVLVLYAPENGAVARIEARRAA